MFRTLLILACALLINHVSSVPNDKGYYEELKEFYEKHTKYEMAVVLGGMSPPVDEHGRQTKVPEIVYVVAGVFLLFFVLFLVACIRVFVCNRKVQPPPPANPAAESNATFRGYRGRQGVARNMARNEEIPLAEPRLVQPPPVQPLLAEPLLEADQEFQLDDDDYLNKSGEHNPEQNPPPEPIVGEQVVQEEEPEEPEEPVEPPRTPRTPRGRRTPRTPRRSSRQRNRSGR